MRRIKPMLYRDERISPDDARVAWSDVTRGLPHDASSLLLVAARALDPIGDVDCLRPL